MNVRLATADDGCYVTDLMTQLGYPTNTSRMERRLQKFATHPDYRTYVTHEHHSKEILGMIGLHASMYYEKDTTYVRIVTLITDEYHRGKGIASLLISAADDWGKSIGADQLFVNTGNRNERLLAQQFYESQQFTKIASGWGRALN
ncbi:GNAT family N-acetyltransferase [Geomicrobium sp. JCM 19039]|uniref:GNAT family N-acetyltransferase n=1 Tax=Geomicrobium sp. JCM 19039 TaxID=1460636 RepID=UPI00045F4861|nr:GNAT family N-acetyltransferase [Geomicrobium sp. JCM 19039]GAK10530.1 acetyltransferase, GNAT family [Geomicrobium sp. JCM 19039]